MKSQRKRPGLGTICVHTGTIPDSIAGGTCSPVVSSASFHLPDETCKQSYPRYFNTPNQEGIGKKVAALENGEDGMVFGSGMAAISTLLLSSLKYGDHAVFLRGIYGGTRDLVTTVLFEHGVDVSWVDSIEGFGRVLQPRTKVFYAETPSNPTLRCIDLRALARLGAESKVTTVVDNTFATPINQNPLDCGIDVVIHSATKYLNGHGDLSAGVLVSKYRFLEEIRKHAICLGGVLNANDCYQLERGLKTLAIRVQKHNENASAIANFLGRHPGVEKVYYPGLESDPGHRIARNQMRGFGGMLAFLPCASIDLRLFQRRLEIIRPAISLGGVDSLVCIPGQTSHRNIPQSEMQRMGFDNRLVRLSVGIEDIDDLIWDLEQGLGLGWYATPLQCD